MGSGKRRRLEATVTAIQRRWGPKAIRRLGRQATTTAAPPPHVPTGFPALDKALAGIGGIPRGRLTELLGAPTSGMATLALKIAARAQVEGDTVAYVDLSGTIDPDYAARCGLKLTRLLLVRPRTGLEALEIIQTLVANRGAGAVLFDAVSDLLSIPGQAPLLAAALDQLPQILAESACAPIFLTPLQHGNAMSAANYPPGFALPHYAAVRLLLQKERWIQRQGDIRGYRAQVRVLKNKLGPAGKRATIAITFNGVVTGDGT